jgi:hypothetical protein
VQNCGSRVDSFFAERCIALPNLHVRFHDWTCVNRPAVEDFPAQGPQPSCARLRDPRMLLPPRSLQVCASPIESRGRTVYPQN